MSEFSLQKIFMSEFWKDHLGSKGHVIVALLEVWVVGQKNCAPSGGVFLTW